MDEIRIWNVARTEKEINEFMMTTLNGDEPGLNAHYSFDGGNAKDNTKNKNDGKDAFGKSKYVDVTRELDLESLSVSFQGRLTATWARIKQMR
jgi:hypothetical protein